MTSTIDKLSPLAPFHPLAWARNNQVQTILADWIPSRLMKDPGSRWVVDLKDGDRLACRLSEGTSDFVVLLCHGLTGSSDSGYNHRIGHIFQGEGHTVCRMNHRNCGEGLGLAKKPYSAGRSEDLARIVFELKKRYPSKKIVVIGFSMSGNASLLLASGILPIRGVFSRVEFDRQAPLHQWALPDYVIAVNPPVDLSRTADRFLVKFNRVYQWNFIRAFQKLVKDLQKDHLLEEKISVPAGMSIREFDEVFTATRCGFATAEQYYQSCQSVSYLDQVAIPTYILAAKDDPFIDWQELDQTKKSSHIQVHFSEKGGHMGYLHQSKTPLGDHRWMDYAVLQMFKSLTF